jgi:hypothetical protein
MGLASKGEETGYVPSVSHKRGGFPQPNLNIFWKWVCRDFTPHASQRVREWILVL